MFTKWKFLCRRAFLCEFSICIWLRFVFQAAVRISTDTAFDFTNNIVSHSNKKVKDCLQPFTFCKYTFNILFVRIFARNRKFSTSSCTAGCQYFPSAGGRHPFPETMLVPSFPVRRLKCPLHFEKFIMLKIKLIHVYLFDKTGAQRYNIICKIAKYFSRFLKNLPKKVFSIKNISTFAP